GSLSSTALLKHPRLLQHLLPHLGVLLHVYRGTRVMMFGEPEAAGSADGGSDYGVDGDDGGDHPDTGGRQDFPPDSVRARFPSDGAGPCAFLLHGRCLRAQVPLGGRGTGGEGRRPGGRGGKRNSGAAVTAPLKIPFGAQAVVLGPVFAHGRNGNGGGRQRPRGVPESAARVIPPVPFRPGHFSQLGTRCWFPDELKGWVSGVLIAREDDPEAQTAKLTFAVDESGEPHAVVVPLPPPAEAGAGARLLPPLRNPPMLEGIDDLTNLSYLNEPAGTRRGAKGVNGGGGTGGRGGNFFLKFARKNLPRRGPARPSSLPFPKLKKSFFVS
ncbi:MAG: hypothetical protein BJ554DRAFT_3294, partial [Olpidium bornovanus]